MLEPLRFQKYETSISGRSTACSSNPTGEKTVTNPSHKSQRWTRQQIRDPRLAPLVGLLQKRGLQLVAREAGNFILPAYPGLIVKDSYQGTTAHHGCRGKHAFSVLARVRVDWIQRSLMPDFFAPSFRALSRVARGSDLRRASSK